MEAVQGSSRSTAPPERPPLGWLEAPTAPPPTGEEASNGFNERPQNTEEEKRVEAEAAGPGGGGLVVHCCGGVTLI